MVMIHIPLESCLKEVFRYVHYNSYLFPIFYFSSRVGNDGHM